VAAVAAADAQHAGQGVPPSPPVTRSAILASRSSRPGHSCRASRRAWPREVAAAGMGDDPAVGTVVPSGHEAMRTGWSRNPVSVARVSCQTNRIGHNDTLPEPCRNVRTYPGGLADWEAAGYPIEANRVDAVNRRRRPFWRRRYRQDLQSSGRHCDNGWSGYGWPPAPAAIAMPTCDQQPAQSRPAA
jgi:hypothetical protein